MVLKKSYTCEDCGLYKSCKSPKMQPFGNFKKGIMNIAEAPGEIEDEKGKQFQGKTGELLRRTYESFGISLFDDCINLNAVNCRPMTTAGENRTPKPVEIDSCRRYVIKAIMQYKPKVIVLFGGTALESVIGDRWKRDLGGITKWQGFTIPDQDYNAWIIPTFHPSFVERSETGEVLTIWKQDMQKIIDYSTTQFLKYNPPVIEILEDISILDDIKLDTIAIDFETTGLKPHAEGHEIISVAIADKVNHAFAFLLPKQRREMLPLLRILKDDKIEKIAHHMKFESMWSEVILGTEIKNWVWDTMIASHIFNNHTGITSLQFQSYVNFGIINYKDETTSYLKGDADDSSNGINHIRELIKDNDGKMKLLKRNGLDAVYTLRLAGLQRSELLPF